MSDVLRRAASGLSYLAGDGGRGAKIVLLHGIGSNAESFAPLIEALAGQYSVIAWDAPGYGDSQPLEADWPDASDYAQAVERLLAALEWSRCIVLGHSLGALMAARFAVDYPQRVVALALVSPALGYDAAKGAPLPPAVAKRIEELDRLGPQGFAAARSPGLLADPTGRPEVLRAVERAMAAVRRPGYDQAARLLATGRLLGDVAKVEAPTAVLVGSADRITPPAHVRRAFDALPHSPHHIYREVANAGHAIAQELPGEVARAIDQIAATSNADA